MKAFTAITLVLGIFAASATQADAHKGKQKGWHGHHHASAMRGKPQVRGYIVRTGGHRYGYELTPFLYRNGPYGNYPHFDDRNFWERVQSGPLSQTTSPSGF